MRGVVATPIRLYRWLMQGRVSACRFVPSCSSFALEAVEVHGACKGSLLAVGRLCRCNPWGKSGFDPVPSRVSSVS